MGKSKSKNNGKRWSSGGGGAAQAAATSSLFGPIATPKNKPSSPKNNKSNKKGSSTNQSGSKSKSNKKNGQNAVSSFPPVSLSKKQTNQNASKNSSAKKNKKSVKKKAQVTKAVGPNHHFKHKKPKLGLGLPHSIKVDRHATNRSVKIPVKSFKKSHFQLHMPVESKHQKCRDMPWFSHYKEISNEHQQKKESKSGGNKSGACLLPTTLFDESFLQKLDQELLAFADYVRLTPLERDAREHLIQHVADLCGILFDANKSPNVAKRQRLASSKDAVSVQAFGSHATPDVCCFASDVDLALWGVVPASTHISFVSNEPDGLEINAENKLKEERVQKWRQALQEVEAANTGTVADKQSGKGEADQKKDAIANDSTAIAVGEGENLKQDTEAKDPKPAEDNANSYNNSAGDLLFVIDRVGAEDFGYDEDPAPIDGTADKECKNESDMKQNDQDNGATEITTVQATVGTESQVAVASSNLELEATIEVNEKRYASDTTKDGIETSQTGQKESVTGPDNGSIAEKESARNEPGTSKDVPLVIDDDAANDTPNKLGTCKEAPLVVNDNDSSSRTAIDLCSDSDEGDSDNDSADKLQSYRKRSHSDVQPTDDEDDARWKALVEAKRRTVSLSSSTSGDDDDNDIYDDMQVSFVSRAPYRRQKAPQFGPTGHTRKLVIGALQSLGRKMRQSPLTHTVEVRRFARVPIITMATHLGFEGDVAIGGHNGTDTSQYASMQTQRYESFACVVLLLKILLIQQGLDKPFTGGLGSYKLYVLVAHHLERHVALGGSDRPSEILLSFFFRYSGISNIRDVDSDAATRLSQTVVLRSDGGSADLQPVFNIDHCTRLFNICWERLLKRQKDNMDEASFLGGVIDATKLRHEREECLRKAALWRKNHKSSGNANGGRKVGHVFRKSEGRNETANNRQRPSGDGDCDAGTDDEAKHLMAGYGVQRGPRGGLVPRHRPDVEARKAAKHANPRAELLGRLRKNRKNKKKQNRDKALTEFANREL